MDLVNVFSITDIGLVRAANEDSVAVAETINGDLFIVCDGMGGHVGGAVASKLAVDSIVEYFSIEKYLDIKLAINEAIDFANAQILGYVSENPELKGMGTTLCLLIIQDNCAYIAHAGDSRIYLYLNDKKQLHRITKDHSLVQNLIDNNIITEDEAEKHPKKNVILKALGTQKNIAPEISSEAILPLNKDIFLLCSDGLSGLVTDDTIEAVLNENISLDDKGNKLITIAKNNGGTDNISLQLIKINNKKNKKRVFISKNNNIPFENTNPSRKPKFLLFIIIALLIISITIPAVIFRNKIINTFNSFKQEDTIINKIDTLKTKKINDTIILPNCDTVIFNGMVDSNNLPDGLGYCKFLNDTKTGRLSFEGLWKNGFKIEGKLIYKADLEKPRKDSAYYVGTLCDTVILDGSKKIYKSSFLNGKFYNNPKDTTDFDIYECGKKLIKLEEKN